MATIEESHENEQLGLQYPDGSTDWADEHGNVQLVGGGLSQVFSLVEPSPNLTALLADRAMQAKMPQDVYLGMHHIMSRTIITTVTAAEVRGSLGAAS